MRAEQIDQVTINVKNLEESVKLFSEVLGINFGDPIEARVAGHDVRFAFSTMGIGLAQQDPPEEGFRALGIKVDDVDEMKQQMDSRGHEPLSHIQAPLKELQYMIGGVRFNFGEYPGAPLPNRPLSLLLEREGIL